MVIRPDADTNFGGDRVQMIETAKALRELGVEVIERVGSTEPSDYEGVDVVHLFNLQTYDFTLQEVKKAKDAGKKIALSTIWWELPAEAGIENSRRWALLAKVAGRKLARAVLQKLQDRKTRFTRQVQKEIVANSDVLLPNSWREAKELQRLDACDRIVVVPNGINAEVFDPGIPYTRPSWIPSGKYVISVGRIEPPKGQLKLAKALNSQLVNCILVGDVKDCGYAETCVQEGALLVGRRSHVELAQAYKHAEAFALPSYRETPGLAALEAAAMGCPVVITQHGSTRDYFAERALFVDPFDESTLARALTKVLDGWRAGGEESIADLFNWRAAAKATMHGYRSISDAAVRY